MKNGIVGAASGRTPKDDLRAAILDTNRASEDRIAAIQALVERDAASAKPIILELAERIDEPRAVLEAAGKALGEIDHRCTRVSEWDLRDVAEVAFNAFGA